MTAPATASGRALRWIAIAVVVLASLGVLALAAKEKAIALVQRRVVAALGPGASVDALETDWRGVDLVGVRLPGVPGWPAPQAFTADRLRIVPSWRSILTDRVVIARIDVTNPVLTAVRPRAGRMRVLPTLLEQPSAAGDAKAATPSAPGTAPAPPRRLSIRAIHVANGTLDLYDETVARPPWKVRLREIEATLNDVTGPPVGGHVPLAMKAVLDGPTRDGRVAIEGWVDAESHDLDLTSSLRDVDLLALHPYVVEEAKARLTSGAVDLDLHAQVRARRLHAPGRVTLSRLAFARNGDASALVLGVPRDLLLAGLQAKGGAITLDFTLEGDVDDPKFSLNEILSTRIAVQLAKTLGFSVGGLVEGLGGLGVQGLEGAGKAATGIGGALRKWIHR